MLLLIPYLFPLLSVAIFSLFVVVVVVSFYFIRILLINNLIRLNSTNNLIVIVVIYRLGRGTSGTILFAKTALAKRELSKQMQERTMKKSYLALVGKNKNKHLKNEIIRISLTFSLDIFLLILSLDGIVKEEKFSVTQPIGPIPYKAITTTGIYYLSIVYLSFHLSISMFRH